MGGGTYPGCACACSIRTQAPNAIAHPATKSCASAIRLNLIVGIIVVLRTTRLLLIQIKSSNAYVIYGCLAHLRRINHANPREDRCDIGRCRHNRSRQRSPSRSLLVRLSSSLLRLPSSLLPSSLLPSSLLLKGALRPPQRGRPSSFLRLDHRAPHV